MATKRAGRMAEAKPSFVRESLKFASDPSILSFAGGNPDDNLFPAEALTRASQEIMQTQWHEALQYSITEGYIPLRKQLIKWMSKMGIHAELDELIITSGSQQGLDLTAKIFVDPGDTILVESPTYMGAINAFKYYQPHFVEVDMDEDGMMMDDLEKKLREHPEAKFIYTIPDFQNPTGRVMAKERRQRLVELARQYDVLVIEDSPYISLRYDGVAVPPVKYYDTDGHVVYLGTMSKILCPGMRIGWVVGSKDIIRDYVVLKQAADLSTTELAQRMAAHYLIHEDIEAHIAILNREYKKKKDTMLDACQKYFPSCIRATHPEGGLFLWMELPEGYDTLKIFQDSLKTERVIFVPGDTFYPYGGHPNTLRLCFSTTTAENIEKGMGRMGRVFTKVLSKPVVKTA